MRYGAVTIILVMLIGAGLSVTGCREDGSLAIGSARRTASGLKPGINYMQPMKWRMTYRYRVQQVIPTQPFYNQRPMEPGSEVKAVGPGTFEVWFAGPREGEEIRNVELIKAIPEPTVVKPGSDTDVDLYYYNMSPGNRLPDQITTTLAWEFVTFERYTHWTDLPRVDYDKSSELYKQYTREEAPISFHPVMQREARQIFEDSSGDPMLTALGCYNFMLANFRYDYNQQTWIMLSGLDALTDSYRAWENKHGICDEFACVYVAMLRSVGIPARPVAGMSHPMTVIPGDADNRDSSTFLSDYEKKFGPMLFAGGHAWAEFYMPEVGWIPVDPTWGNEKNKVTIPKSHSAKGASREIPIVDYYFGKMDPFRIPWFKDWNYGLQPRPVTPESDHMQDWMFAYTERTSGVDQMRFGWPGAYGSGGG